jgi:formylglycine-generating enzyme required for sulfatase activity
MAQLLTVTSLFFTVMVAFAQGAAQDITAAPPVTERRVALRALARPKGFKPWGRIIQVAADARQSVDIDLKTLDKVIKGRDGVEMVLIPAGKFWMGSAQQELDLVVAECKQAGNPENQCREWYKDELPRHHIDVGPFYLDRYEVTNAQFEWFVRAADYRTTAEREGWGVTWTQKDVNWQWLKTDGATWRSPSGPGSSAPADHPVVQVSWEDAVAYCRWAGKRLPTEAEWEKAARGADGRRYPWGETWDPSRVNGNMTVKTTTPVGSYPAGASPFDVHDMAGSVWEWISSLYKPYPYAGTDGREDLTGSGRRVYRGGSWSSDPWILRSAVRNRFAPAGRSAHVGFRCAQGAN